MTSLSGSSEVSGASRMTERAVGWLLSARSSRSIGEPERQITRVPRRSGTLARRISSISTLSRSARTTITGFLRLSLARVSSRMIVKIESDQPRMTVWSFSRTVERPRRRSASLASMPVAITPMSALTMKRPAMVSSSIVSRKRHWKSPSPATVPGSSAWKRFWISSRTKPSTGSSVVAQPEDRDDEREHDDQRDASRRTARRSAPACPATCCCRTSSAASRRASAPRGAAAGAGVARSVCAPIALVVRWRACRPVRAMFPPRLPVLGESSRTGDASSTGFRGTPGARDRAACHDAPCATRGPVPPPPPDS